MKYFGVGILILLVAYTFYQIGFKIGSESEKSFSYGIYKAIDSPSGLNFELESCYMNAGFGKLCSETIKEGYQALANNCQKYINNVSPHRSNTFCTSMPGFGDSTWTWCN